MATIRKLSAFRQLSLSDNTVEQRRTKFKKQFSQDTDDSRKIKSPPLFQSVKIAWDDPTSDEGVIIAKKCISKETMKKPKLTRHNSLEKDSILYTKQEQLRAAFTERQKPNLNIFLAAAHVINTSDDDVEQQPSPRQPKLIPPLIASPLDESNNLFQRQRQQQRHQVKTQAVIVMANQDVNNKTPPSSVRANDDGDNNKAIKDVIIRPSTAAMKRERFQKRTNSAFNGAIVNRPPLIRSTSAPTTRNNSEMMKLSSKNVKRKIKSSVKNNKKNNNVDLLLIDNKENPKNQKELNRYVVCNGSDVVTMVSLISPSASDNEDNVEVAVENSLNNNVNNNSNNNKKKSSPIKQQNLLGKNCNRDQQQEVQSNTGGNKNVSLRKTVKSVSFQQSSIHAIRSFSASFPARRSSMATAFMLSNNNSKIKEKSNLIPEDNDSGDVKRRLVRSATAITSQPPSDDDDISCCQLSSPITVAIHEKKHDATDVCQNLDEPLTSDDEKPKFGSVKERQCWEMFVKMTDKGLKVSYDTILRGMLTPTEYRMRTRETESSQDVVAGSDDATIK